MAKRKTAAEKIETTETTTAEVKAPAPAVKTKGVKVKVVHPVEGLTVGDELIVDPYEYRFQIKHKSLEIVG